MSDNGKDNDPHRDPRGSEPPAEGGAEEDSAEDGTGEGAGPVGNESDEESLSTAKEQTRPTMTERALRAVIGLLGGYHVVPAGWRCWRPGTFFDEIGRYGAENLHYVGDVGAFTAAYGVALLVAVGRRVVVGADADARGHLVRAPRVQPRLRHRAGPQGRSRVAGHRAPDAAPAA